MKMKTTLTLKWSIKQFSALIVGVLLSCTSVFGQTFTPQYNNNNNATPTGGNSIPFSWNSNGVRGQWLIPANIFVDANGNSAPGGKAIKTLYIYPTSGSFSSPVIYNNMVIKIGQPSITTLSGTWQTTGMQTAVNSTTFSITGGMNQWCEIPLTNKINYDPTKPLVIDVAWTSQRSFNLFYVANKSYSNAARNWATPSTASSGSSGRNWMGILGMDLVSLGPNNAGVSALTSPNNFCPGKYPVNVEIANSGTNQLDSVRINWSLDGVRQTTVKYTTLIDTSGASNGNTANIFLDSVTFANTARIIKIWTSFPNGVKDTVNDDDTLEVRLRSAMSGSFTIGGSGADYQTISAAASDLSNFGVCGAVDFNIAAGTYNERVELTNVSGTSATNTITFRGAGIGQTIVQSTGSSSSDMATWLVNGTEYVSMRDMTIRNNGSTYGVALMVTGGSDYGNYDNMDLVTSTSATSTWNTPLAVTGSTSSTYAYGDAANYCTFDSLRMVGGYWSMTLYGSTSSNYCTGNTVTNCEMTDAYYYGLRSYYQDKVRFDNNLIHNFRNSINYGAMTYYWSNYEFTNNEIYCLYYGHMNYYSNRYGYDNSITTLVANNIVDATAGSGRSIYALYALYSDYTNYYHNTYISDYDNSIAGAVYQLYGTDVNWYNNIFTNKSTGSYGHTFSFRLGTIANMDYNIFDSKGGALVYHNSSFSTIQSYQASYTAYNQNSLAVAPTFISASNYRLDASKAGYRGTDVGILDDIDRDSRCSFAPSIGADESNYPTPTTRAFFAVNDTLYINASTQFNNSAKAGDPMIHEWYIDGTFASNDVDLVAKFPSTGSFNVRLVSEGCGGADTFDKTVYVVLPSSAPVATFISSSTSIDVNDVVKFTNLTTNGADSFYWSVDSYFVTGQFGLKFKSHSFVNGTDSNSLNPQIEFSQPGTYTVCLEAFNIRGSDKICKTAHINVRKAQDMCLISNGSTAASGKLFDEGGASGNYSANRTCYYLIDPCTEKITLSILNFDLATGSYLRVYDGNSANGKPLHAYDPQFAQGLTGSISNSALRKTFVATSGEIYLEFESSTAVAPGFELIWDAEAIATPITTSAAISLPDTVCAGVEFTAASRSVGNDLSSIWFMDTSSGNWNQLGDYEGNIITHSYDTAGTYYVKLLAVGCNGTDSLVQAIEVIDATSAPTASFTLNNARPSIGDAVTLTNTSSSGNHPCIEGTKWIITPSSYSFADGFNEFSDVAQVTFSDTGCFHISLVVYNSFGSDTAHMPCGVYSISTCIPNVKTTGTDVGISRVKVANIDNSSSISSDGYENFTGVASTTLEIGASYDITIERPTPFNNTMNRAVWIDYNQDGVFDNSELVTSSTADNQQSWTENFTIPSSATLGITRMRVGANLGNFKQFGCGPNQFGEFEDYRVIITEDRKAPEVFLNGSASITLEQCATYTDQGAYGVDNVDGNVTASIVSNSVDMSTPGTYTVVYEATDATGNTGSATRTIIVTTDATEPVLTLNGNDVMDLEVFDTYTEPGFTAIDNCDGDISANVVVSGSVNDSTLGISTLTYTITDKEGNQTVLTRTINVVDTEAPVVSLLGNAIDTVEIYTSYTEAGITIADNYYSGLTYRVDGTVNLNRLGAYTLTYTSTDGSGNVSEQLTRTVYVLDQTAPTIILAYGSDTTVLVDVFSKYNLEYADLDDNYSSESTLRTTLTTSGSYVNSFGTGAATQLGDYVVEYTITDESGNSTTVSRNIKVVDREAPMLTFTANPVVISRWQAFDPINDAGAIPSDNYYGESELNVTVTNSDLDVTSAGAYKVEFEVNDPSGNAATYVLDVWVLESTTSVGETSFVTDIYPNPTSGLLNINIEFETAAQTEVAILNSMGQVVMNVSNGVTQTLNESIDLSDIGTGIYYVRIVNNNHQVLKKVVVSK